MPAPNDRWYADVPLSADQHTPAILTVSFQNDAYSEWRQLEWLPLNLVDAPNMVIRQGDSLLLTMRPDENATGSVVITIGTNQLSTTAQNPLARRFDEPGIFTVTGLYDGITQRSIQVRVVGHSMGSPPAAFSGHRRDWDLAAVPSEAVLETDSRVLFQQVAALPGGGRRIGMITDRNEPRYILSRLGTGGPILDSVPLNGFDFWRGSETYLRVIETYEDNSQLLETLVILSPVHPDVTVVAEVVVGGVMFEDGSTVKTLSASDFDSRGQCRLRFIRPASAETSVCHSFQLFHGSVRLNRY
jgi:hypothetical protein